MECLATCSMPWCPGLQVALWNQLLADIFEVESLCRVSSPTVSFSYIYFRIYVLVRRSVEAGGTRHLICTKDIQKQWIYQKASVSCIVQEMEALDYNPILFFKQQGEQPSEVSKALTEQDFVSYSNRVSKRHVCKVWQWWVVIGCNLPSKWLWL